MPPDLLRITDVRLAPARRDLRAKGLLRWVCCVLDGRLQLDGLAVRRTAANEYRISFPSRTDANGVEHYLIKPLGQSTRDEIETQVIGELRRRGFLP